MVVEHAMNDASDVPTTRIAQLRVRLRHRARQRHLQHRLCQTVKPSTVGSRTRLALVARFAQERHQRRELTQTQLDIHTVVRRTLQLARNTLRFWDGGRVRLW